MIVVDASAIAEVLFQTPATLAIETRSFKDGETLHAPHLIDVEVAHTVRRYTIGGQIDAARGRATFAAFASLPLNRYPHTVLLPRIWGLRINVTAYDAAYVALAEALRVPLITCDRRLAGMAGRQVQRADLSVRPALPIVGVSRDFCMAEYVPWRRVVRGEPKIWSPRCQSR